MKGKRILLWSELSPELKLAAVAKLRRMADLKASYDGTVLPYAWPERIAPLLRYTPTPGRAEIWGCEITPAHRAQGTLSMFTLTPLPMEAVA